LYVFILISVGLHWNPDNKENSVKKRVSQMLYMIQSLLKFVLIILNLVLLVFDGLFG